jgi:glycosyltransferase involved in cell wall biosynthesis
MSRITLFIFLLFSPFYITIQASSSIVEVRDFDALKFTQPDRAGVKAEKSKLPTVCLNMIVKNETKVICRCLESVKPLIDYWVIVDTGSTDGTQDLIKSYMKDIPGELYERPWVNFAHNRNEALQLAKNKANYLLFIDADDKLEIAKDFVRPKLDKDAYRLKIQYSGSAYYRPQIIHTRLNWKWAGVLHEALVCDEEGTIDNLDGVTMLIVGGGDRSTDPKKFEKDALVLEKALEEDPTSARNVFYLAQSYRDAQKPQLAIKNYERRVAMGGWEEEVFWSLYRIAELQESLNMPEETLSKSYSKAYRFRPTRAEPLYRLSSYYRQNENYLLGYLLSQFALKIKYPEDNLFVEYWIYDYGILLEYSICAYWIGLYKEAFESCNQLLSQKTLPENIRECVEKNLTFILPKIIRERESERVSDASPKCKSA